MDIQQVGIAQRPPNSFTSANKQQTLPTPKHHFCKYNQLAAARFADLPALQLRTLKTSLSVSKNTANISLLLPNTVNILISKKQCN